MKYLLGFAWHFSVIIFVGSYIKLVIGKICTIQVVWGRGRWLKNKSCQKKKNTDCSLYIFSSYIYHSFLKMTVIIYRESQHLWFLSDMIIVSYLAVDLSRSHALLALPMAQWSWCPLESDTEFQLLCCSIKDFGWLGSGSFYIIGLFF